MTARAHRRLRVALRACIAAAVLGAGAGGAGALTLGDIELRSALGEALDARIPVRTEEGEALRGACFSLAPAARGGIPQVRDATLELRRHAHGADLLVKSRAPVAEPAVGLGIDIACPGSQAAIHRTDFPILLEPRGAQAGAAANLGAANLGAAKTDTATSLGSLPGDSLAAIAAKIFPADRAARDEYLQAMRAQNPSLALLGDGDELPANTVVALPELHAFARRHRAAPVALAAKAPATTPASAPARTPASAPVPRVERPHRPAPAPARVARSTSPGAFQLRLSAPVMDLSPSRAMTDEERARLRERLLVLEADDRTASMLAMLESIRKLQSQVAALELKLAQAPAAMPPAPVAMPPAPVAPSSPPIAKADAVPPAPLAAKPAPPVAEPAPPVVKPAAPASEPAHAPVAASVPEPPKPGGAEKPAAVPEPAPAGPKPAPQRRPRANPRPASAAAWYEAPWVLPGALALVVVALALLLLRRRRGSASGDEEFADTPDLILDSAPVDETVIADVAGEEPIGEFDRTTRVEMAPDAAAHPPAPTRIPAEDSAELRRRYIEERFPEIVNGALVLDDPASVVKAARLLYEDGAAARAIELLQYAIEQDPGEPAIWLALFEIFRIERLRGEFEQLALRFRARHAGAREWPGIQQAGREVDPGNALYGDGDGGARFDPAAENWLQVPPSTAGTALAAELRGALMEGASVSEGDLQPDPTPALRKAENIRIA